ncbi:MAG: cupin domain-containing protein [Acetobacteraceae bacterium]|jgi:quercetin dioxygenase-like cupin family protein|nr:cupin domain-containing protein [Acetobacteraceae bacterium]
MLASSHKGKAAWQRADARASLPIHRTQKGQDMTRDEFEADLLKQGYGVFYGGFRAGLENPEHTHPWDARLFILGGEITITQDGKAICYRAGDTCAVAANYPHAEQVGPSGVAFMSGRK